MPTNLYGPDDNYHLQNSHVLPALLRRIHEAKLDGAAEVTIWGTGTPRREFLHVDDLARACVFLMKTWTHAGPDQHRQRSGGDVLELARLIAEIVGWRGTFVFDRGKPDGTPRKLLDVSRLSALGWTASIPLREGLTDAYRDFKARSDAGEFSPTSA